MGLLMAEEIDRRGCVEELLEEDHIRAEPCSDAMRKRMEQLSGAETFEIYGLTDFMGQEQLLNV